MESKMNLEERKRLLQEINDIKNEYITTVKNMPLQELIPKTIEFLETLSRFKTQDEEVNNVINQYWQMAYANFQTKELERKINESQKGR